MGSRSCRCTHSLREAVCENTPSLRSEADVLAPLPHSHPSTVRLELVAGRGRQVIDVALETRGQPNHEQNRCIHVDVPPIYERRWRNQAILLTASETELKEGVWS